MLTGYDTAGAVIATKEQLLPTACQWQPGVFRLPLREIGERVHFISWRITNSGPSDVYLDELQLQTVEVVQENHYYAFGLDMAGVSKTAANSHSYLYQGKELEEEIGNYDFHWRSYDQKLGRTWQVDPHAESYQNVSAYSWVANNPLNMIDPDGRDIVETEDKTTYTGEDAASMFSTIKSSLGRGNENGCPEGDCDKNNQGTASKQSSGDYNYYSDASNALSLGSAGMWAYGDAKESFMYRNGYRSSPETSKNFKLPTKRAVSLFGNKYPAPNLSFKPLSSNIGRIGTGLGIFGVMHDTYNYSEGNLSGARFTYHTASFGVSWALAAASGSSGVGAVVGIGSFSLEKLWDHVVEPSLQEIALRAARFERAISSGKWLPVWYR